MSERISRGRSYFLAYINELCDRIDAAEPRIHAFIAEPGRRKRLTGEALTLIERYPDKDLRPPLFGIPVGIKDIFSVDGFETTCGSQLPAELFAGPEAPCVSALRHAGALVAGKTVTAEFAYFEPGPTRNPRNASHTPGGSSSGSAAAVAAGLCPLALGSQTIGSIIRPAAYCGIIGFKPTCDRVSSSGVIPYSASSDQVGLFAQDMDGMAVASAVVCSRWNERISSAIDVHLPRLGVPEGPYLDQATPGARFSFENTIMALKAAGYTVRLLPVLGDINIIAAHHRNMTSAEFAAAHARWFERYGDRYRPRTAELIRFGRSVSEEALRKGRASRLAVRTSLERTMDMHEIDLWISPAATGTAPEGIASTGDPAMNLPWTHAGMPTITIPSGKDKKGLPYGLQITARFMKDEILLSWARGIEDVSAAAFN
ncbi:MAG: amidase [Deltaproteobacteria bacterium]|nr:amidase [Deltaproteobacteria bacterium]